MKEPVFVGRERELEELRQHLNQALAGKGQVCFITGQAGTGKTALVRQFMQQALTADADLVLSMGSCNAQTGIGDPYLPFREALAMLTGDAAQQSADKVAPENINRLRAVLARSIQVLVEVAPDLIGVFVPGAKLVGTVGKAVATKAGWMDQLSALAKPKVAVAGPMVEQSRIFEQYTAYLQRLSTKTPLFLFLDDLQWADNASLGLLFQLGRHIESHRILILGAYRPNDVALGRGGERHPLEPVAHELTRYYGDVSVDLDAIPETVNRRFVDTLLDAEPNDLGQGFRQALYHQTGGHALFTVELIRALQERGDLVRNGEGRWREGRSLDWDALPARVEGVIAERIDRLSAELKQVLRVGSVEGEQFTAEVVARVQSVGEREMIRELSDDLQRRHRLVRAQGVVQLGPQRLSLYRFLHNLFQQYVYGSLDEAEQAYLHRDVGEVIEALSAGQTDEMAAQLARHFEEAGIPAKAAAYRLQAGNRARRMSAHEEATAHLTRGLELVASLPQGDVAMKLELGLQSSLGMVLIATAGYASPDVERAFARARELCRALGDPAQTAPVLTGQVLFHTVRGELYQACDEGEQLLHLAQLAGDAGLILAAHAVLGTPAVHLGRLDDARAHLEQAIALYDRRKHRELTYQFGQDPEVTALSYLSWVLWFQGYPDQAVGRQSMALKLAAEIDHPYSLAMATLWAAILHQMMRRWPECRALAEASLLLASQERFPLWQAASAMVHATAIAYLGHTREGIAEMTQGLASFAATGSKLGQPYYRACLAKLHFLGGRRDEGLRVIEESLTGHEQAWWLPEQYRLRGELLLLSPGNEVEAEAVFRQALEVARSQKSKSLELRAAMSAARLLQQQRRTAEGQDVLGECYASFTEGFDTPDLREARELLAQLGSSVQGSPAKGG